MHDYSTREQDPPAPPPIEELWTRAVSGELASRNLLCRRIDALAKRYARDSGWWGVAQEDARQEVQVSILRHLDSTPCPRNLDSFVKWRIKSAIKKLSPRKHKTSEEIQADQATLAVQNTDYQPAEKRLTGKEESTALRDCIEGLPPSIRAAVHHKFWLEEAVFRSAEKQSVSSNTVRNRIKKALTLLEACLRLKGVVK